MTQEEREKAIQIMVDRYMSGVTYGLANREKGLEYARFHYDMYSDEALLSLIFNHIDHSVYSTT